MTVLRLDIHCSVACCVTVLRFDIHCSVACCMTVLRFDIHCCVARCMTVLRFDIYCCVQGRIQVRLWGGGEFQLVELMYILGENKNVNLVGLIYSNLSRKGCI